MSDALILLINENLKSAMRAKDVLRLSVIRMLKAQIKQVEIDQQTTLQDNDVLTIVTKMIKQRRESAKQFTEAQRDELAAKEYQEIDILQDYLPEPLSEPEVDTAIQAAIRELQAATLKDMGKVMNLLQSRLQGKTDMSTVSKKVKTLLG